MAKENKIRVAVLYGGMSSEHEVSIKSAQSIINHLDSDRFKVIPVAVSKEGRWRTPKALDQGAVVDLDSLESLKEVQPPSSPHELKDGLADVYFPIIHGTTGEDGILQGLLEMARVPYVGSGVLGSALGMDKELAKILVSHRGVPVVPSVCLHQHDFQGKIDLEAIVQPLGLPLFVKPVNAGSSVGVHKVSALSELRPALEDAFRFDFKVLIEKGVDAREIEISVLENINDPSSPLVSLPGEIVPSEEFYDYKAKYQSGDASKLIIPAELNSSQIQSLQETSSTIFKALELQGMSRVDFLMDKTNQKIYFNEVNTLPGFTNISMYPKLWEKSGISYGDLLSRLIDLAVDRKKKKDQLVYHV